MNSDSAIRPAVLSDAAACTDIYAHYVRESIATFEEEPPTAEDMAQRIQEAGELGLPWLVAELEEQVVGYAYASRWKGRCAYRYSLEITVYLDHRHCGHGLGRRLYERLFPELAELGYRVLIAGISLPNEASVGLHEAMGMTKAGQFDEVGYKFGQWIDVGYWQKILPADARPAG